MRTERRRRCVAALVTMLQAAACAQLFVSLFLNGGELLRDEAVALSPVRVCVLAECGSRFHSTVAAVAIPLCAYGPLALTLFAALAHLFGVCVPDGPCLALAAFLQTLGATGTFVAIFSILAPYWRLLCLPALTGAFYLSAAACLEMGVAAFLCRASWHRLTAPTGLIGTIV